MKAPPWLLVAPELLVWGRLLELDPVEARHVSGALRLAVGKEVVLADGKGRVAAAKLVTVHKRKVEVEVLSVESRAAPDGDGVTLAVAVVSGKAWIGRFRRPSRWEFVGLFPSWPRGPSSRRPSVQSDSIIGGESPCNPSNNAGVRGPWISTICPS